MAYQILADDLAIIKQRTQSLDVKIEILNKSLKTIDRVYGELVEDSFTVNAESDIRRTISLSFIIKDKSFLISDKSRLWFDKYIKVWVGYKYQRTQSVRYYPMGLYTFSNASYQYNAASSMLTLSCVDLMGELNGLRNGQLSALVTSIPANSDIRQSIISIITQLGGVKKYMIEDIQKLVPYDIDVSAGTTIYNIVTQLKDLYPGWEMYFDEDTFVCQQIPSRDTSALFLSSETFTPLIISENTEYNLSEVKNCTEIWGKCIDSDYYTESVANIDNQYNITIDSFVPTDDDKIPSRTLIGFKVNSDNLSAPTVKLNNFGAYPIVDFTNESPLNANELLEDKSLKSSQAIPSGVVKLFSCL